MLVGDSMLKTDARKRDFEPLHGFGVDGLPVGGESARWGVTLNGVVFVILGRDDEGIVVVDVAFISVLKRRSDLKVNGRVKAVCGEEDERAGKPGRAGRSQNVLNPPVVRVKAQKLSRVQAWRERVKMAFSVKRGVGNLSGFELVKGEGVDDVFHDV